MRHPELVGADLDPPALVPETSALPRKGHSALGLGFRKDVMLRLYHAFLGLRNRPQPLTGKGCLLHKQKNPHRTADGTQRVRITTAGGLSPHCHASREDITLGWGVEHVRPPTWEDVRRMGVYLTSNAQPPPNQHPLLAQRG